MRFWLNDRLVEDHEARVSVLDHGFTVADGVFETLKVADGVPFAVTRHLRRLTSSAAALGLHRPDDAMLRDAIDRTIDANLAEIGPLGRLRITMTAGTSPLGSDRGHSEPTIVVAIAAMSPWPETAAVVTVPWPRNERSPLAGVKSTSYAENVLALAQARQAGASEALMADTQGRLCEGTGSNVFCVLGGRLITPTLATGCLPGITRELVLEWTDAVEEDLSLADLSRAEEVFLTSSTRDVQPVHLLDARVLPAPGDVTVRVREEFTRRSALAVDP